jgi:hypothetical protein
MQESDPKPGPFDHLPEADDVALTQHRAWVGHVAGIWAVFEHSLDSAAISLANIPPDVGFCFTAQVIGPARKLDAYIALARLRGADALAKKLNEFANATTSLAERRNRVVHDPWMIFGKFWPIRFEVTARRILRNKPISVSDTEMDKLIKDLIELQNRFLELHERVMAVAHT